MSGPSCAKMAMTTSNLGETATQEVVGLSRVSPSEEVNMVFWDLNQFC